MAELSGSSSTSRNVSTPPSNWRERIREVMERTLDEIIQYERERERLAELYAPLPPPAMPCYQCWFKRPFVCEE